MVMDNTQWSQSSDNLLANAPICSGTYPLTGPTSRGISGDIWNYVQIILGNAGEGAWLISEIHPDKTWVEFWIYDNGEPLGTHVAVEPGDSYRGGKVTASYEDETGDADITDLSLAWWDGDQYTKFYGCLAASDLNLMWPRHTSLDDTDAENVEIHAWVPYWWQRVDITEILWAFLKHHAQTNGSIDALYHKADAIAASTIIDEQCLHHQLFDYYRQAGESFGRSFQRMLQGTDIWLGMGIFASGAMTLGLRLIHPEALATDSTLIDLDDGITEFGVRALHVTDGNEYLYNAITSRWGTIASVTKNFDYTIGVLDVVESTSLPLIASPPNEAESLNTLEAKDEDSVEAYGRRSVSVDQPFLNAPDWASAGIDLRWVGLSRVISFAMGPRAFSFNVGDIINIKDSTEGLDGTESFLVIEMDYNLDTLLVSIKAIEMLEPGVMKPDAAQLRNKLRAWYHMGADGESPLEGVYYETTLGNVNQWLDQGPGDNHADSPSPLGSFDYPWIRLNDPPGFNSLDFAQGFSTAINAGMEITSLDIRIKTGWTIFFVTKADLSSTCSDQCLLSITPMGDDGSGTPDNGFEFGVYDFTSLCTGRFFFRAGATVDLDEFGGLPSDDWQVISLRYDAYRPDRAPRPLGFPRQASLTLITNGTEPEEHRSIAGPPNGLSADKNDISTQRAFVGNNAAGTAKWQGRIAEVIIYHEALAVHQFKMVDRYLRQKYGLGV